MGQQQETHTYVGKVPKVVTCRHDRLRRRVRQMVRVGETEHAANLDLAESTPDSG